MRIYFAELAGTRCAWALGLQLLWIAVFVAAGRVALAKALARTNVQGG